MTLPAANLSDSTPGGEIAWYSRAVEHVARELRTDLERGLASNEATRRLAADGPNEIRKAEEVSPLALLVGQFQSVVIWVLIGAAIVSVFLGEVIDGAAILAIVVVNAVIGFFQEYRAEQAVAALARMTAPRARVIRDGHADVIPTAAVVRGDIVAFEAGDLVAADARLIDAASLRLNEAPLTGESEPVAKSLSACPAETQLADRRNMVFLGTSVASGSGRAIVTATGMATEVGRIAALLETASSDETPLQRKLDRVGKRLLWACLGIVVVVFALGLLRSLPAFELFLTSVSLAVAAIPEGLPAVVTIALALGVSRMARRSALVRRLPAVETLGSAQVICTDKTGTLTVGEMTVRKIVIAEKVLAVTGEGYSTEGGFSDELEGEHGPAEQVLPELLVAAAGCNDAELFQGAGRGGIVGDPTEGALLVMAAKGGVRREAVEAEWPRVAVIPFDSERKRMTIIRRRGDEVRALVKGAPEVILERCSRIHSGGSAKVLSEADRGRMLEAAAVLGNDALRVLALAERSLARIGAEPDAEEIERDLTLLGLVGLQDPPRAEAREAVARCRRAGIRVVMITGDHPGTARAIARELGILEAGDEVVIGSDLERMSDADLAQRVARIAVYARVTAEHKLRVVRAWKANRFVVAMTGDGVNDAPALKEASIGIAMGVTGTEVTKEAADLVIADDNFASIVAAVEEGRGIYDNIAKTLGYLLGGNAGELAVMLVAVLIGWPLPLLPIQLLWINLVTDGLPALALATDPIDPEVLQRPPRRADAELMDHAFLGRLVLTGTLTAGVTLAAFAYELFADRNVVDARNAAFTALVIAELLRSFGARSDTRTVWELGFFTNLRLFAIVAVSIGLQILMHHVPGLEQLFGTVPITAAQCVGWTVLGSIPFLVLEGRKLIQRRLPSTAT